MFENKEICVSKFVCLSFILEKKYYPTFEFIEKQRLKCKLQIMQLITTQFKEMELRIMYHKLPVNRGIMA